MEVNLKLSQDEGEALEDPGLYRRMIGKLLYLTITRPYISYVMNKLSQFLSVPRVPHLQALNHVLQYVKGNPGQGLFFASNSEMQLKAYTESSLTTKNDVQCKVFTDADWASCPDTRRSITGFWEILWCLGNQRNSRLCPDLLQKQSTEQWLMLVVS
ncbi:hypothetical protein UlMin_005310 [Ulmus minor]